MDWEHGSSVESLPSKQEINKPPLAKRKKGKGGSKGGRKEVIQGKGVRETGGEVLEIYFQISEK
jgi:hypothetical protein